MFADNLRAPRGDEFGQRFARQARAHEIDDFRVAEKIVEKGFDGFGAVRAAELEKHDGDFLRRRHWRIVTGASLSASPTSLFHRSAQSLTSNFPTRSATHHFRKALKHNNCHSERSEESEFVFAFGGSDSRDRHAHHEALWFAKLLPDLREVLFGAREAARHAEIEDEDNRPEREIGGEQAPEVLHRSSLQ